MAEKSPAAKKPVAKPAAKPVVKPVAKKPVAPKPAAGQEINKSEEIRKVATSMKAEGKKPRPVVIIDVLKKKGVVVSSPQVSMVLKKMGFRPRKRRKAAAAGSGSVASKGAAPKKQSQAGTISVDDLVAAKKVAMNFGNADRAIAALSALKKFEG